jgi:regulator of protease activity HflC (stomatin/prohibitin superfamily)
VSNRVLIRDDATAAAADRLALAAAAAAAAAQQCILRARQTKVRSLGHKVSKYEKTDDFSDRQSRPEILSVLSTDNL